MSTGKKTVTLVPKYIKEFKCIGGACEDTCCQGWKITIDKETYKKYRNCRSSELRKKLDVCIKRNRKDPSENNYAQISLNNARCPFLTEESLCEIHGGLGEKYLSITCSVYPRKYNIVNGALEKSATMSCPEVARQVLLNPNIMEFEYDETFGEVESLVSKVIDSRGLDNDIINYFWELRVFTIQVLQARAYKLWERLVILGIFYQTVQEYIDNKTLSEIPALISEYIDGIEKGIFDQNLKEIPSNAIVQIELLIGIMNQKMKTGIASYRYAECFDEFVKGIKPNEETAYGEIINNYMNAFQRFYIPFMDEHQHILENYLVNYVFKNLFPLSSGKSIFMNYTIMIVHYSLIKMHLIGMMAYHKESFNLDHVVKFIQSFAKTVEHNSKFIDDTISLLEKEGNTTLSHMLVLIKD